MNRLEEIQGIIKNFIYEKQQMKQEIALIEEKRNTLAQKRNNIINENKGKAYTEEVQAGISELGNQIKELGNQSQELQNKLDKKYLDIKNKVEIETNHDISSLMPEIRKIEEEIHILQQNNKQKEDREQRYEKQRQEFFEKFGRMPNLSENARQENEIQEKIYQENKKIIDQLNEKIKEQEDKISKLAKVAQNFRKRDWSEYVVTENKVLDSRIDNQPKVELEKKEALETLAKKIAENVVNPIVEQIINSHNDVKPEENNMQIDESSEDIILPLCEEENTINEIAPIEEIVIDETSPIEEIVLDKIEPIEEINIKEVTQIEEIAIDELAPIGELNINDTVSTKEINNNELEPIEKIAVKESNIVEENNNEKIYSIEEMSIEELDNERSLEEILNAEEEKIEKKETNKEHVAQNINIEQEKKDIREEKTKSADNQEEIIAYKENCEDNTKIVTNFGEKVTLLNINAKFENDEIVYKAQASNGDFIKVYPRKSQTGNILLKDKENREELKEILINYAIAEYRIFDKKVIKKIDPSICEVLIRFAKKYNYDAQSLIYNYAMSFSKNDELEIDNIPLITYNFTFIQETNLDKKEKDVITKICKNAKKNNKIDIIGYNLGFKKIRYMLKRTFGTNNANALPEGKY